MVGAKKIEGVWFPGFVCEKCNSFFTYEEIFGKEGLEKELSKMRYKKRTTEWGGEVFIGRP
jgi:hypothetical protein